MIPSCHRWPPCSSASPLPQRPPCLSSTQSSTAVHFDLFISSWETVAWSLKYWVKRCYTETDALLIIQWFFSAPILPIYHFPNLILFQDTVVLFTEAVQRCSSRTVICAPLFAADRGVNERANIMKDLCLRRCYGRIKSGIFYLFCPFVWFPVMQTINRVEELSAL